MKILTFGWDYPPQTAGGLGVACYGITRELLTEGVEVIFVLPRKQPTIGQTRFIFADIKQAAKVYEVPSHITPYQSSSTLVELYDSEGVKRTMHTLLAEVHWYAIRAREIAASESFSIIHAHDWTTYLAGLAAKSVSGKPLIVHVHATAFDQAASEQVDPEIYQIERRAFHEADAVVAVSQFTKQLLIDKYAVQADKIEVVHNGIDTEEPPNHEPTLQELRVQGKKIVLYHGRITVQKGVDYFVAAARRVIDHDPDVVFIISGSGDMERQIMHQVGALGLSAHVRFAGALWSEDRDRMYQSVDLVVMPSVSEPFGLVPLEAMLHRTPSLISRQSGVSEVMTNVLKVDFWDIDEMAHKILSALRYPVMRRQLVNEGKNELRRMSWQVTAGKLMALYRRLLQYVRS